MEVARPASEQANGKMRATMMLLGQALDGGACCCEAWDIAYITTEPGLAACF